MDNRRYRSYHPFCWCCGIYYVRILRDEQYMYHIPFNSLLYGLFIDIRSHGLTPYGHTEFIVINLEN